MARWDGPPFAGEVWRLKRVPGIEVRTRHVIDRTLGGDVIFVEGRYYRGAVHYQCDLEEWMDWAEEAKMIRTDPMGKR